MVRLSPWRAALSTLVLSAHGHHGGSKRSVAIGSILFVMALFVACSDDDSSFATRLSDGSSSSVCEDCDDESSSSVKSSSSSAPLRIPFWLTSAGLPSTPVCWPWWWV